MRITYGDIFIVDLSPITGSEQGGIRPCVIVQNNVGNVFSNITIVIPITSSIDKKYMGPSHLSINKSLLNNLTRDGIILCEQIRAVDKSRLKKKIGKLNNEEILLLKKSLCNCLNL